MRRMTCLITICLVLSGCAAGKGNSVPAESAAATTLKSASGSIVGSVGVLKNYFFNNYSEHCSDWSLSGTTSDYLTYGECAGTDTYFWLFSDTEQRDALADKIRQKGLPMLVSDEWIIVSPLDLKPAQEDIGGAINLP